jgi:hypothetical protein
VQVQTRLERLALGGVSPDIALLLAAHGGATLAHAATTTPAGAGDDLLHGREVAGVGAGTSPSSMMRRHRPRPAQLR